MMNEKQKRDVLINFIPEKGEVERGNKTELISEAKSHALTDTQHKVMTLFKDTEFKH